MIGQVAPQLSGFVGLGLAVPGGVVDLSDFTPAPGSPGSSSGSLNLPGSPEAAAWAAFVEQVANHPDLQGLVTFRAWSGEEVDADDPAEGDLPWVRFSPSAGKRERWATGGVWHSPIMVHVDVITAGNNVTDSLNLHSAITSLIESSSFQAAMSEAGASGVWYEEGGYGVRASIPKYEPTVEGSIFAAGAITIDLYIQYED